MANKKKKKKSSQKKQKELQQKKQGLHKKKKKSDRKRKKSLPSGKGNFQGSVDPFRERSDALQERKGVSQGKKDISQEKKSSSQEKKVISREKRDIAQRNGSVSRKGKDVFRGGKCAIQRRARTIRLTRFWKIYFASTGTALLLILIALGIVSGRLAEYEEVQPKYIAAEVFHQYFEPMDYTKLLADAQYDAGEADADEIRDYLAEEIGDSKLTYSIGSSGDPSEVRYLVKAGSKQLGAILLNVSDETTRHGFQTYEFSRVELYLNTSNADLNETANFDVTIHVPADYSVTVDGDTLSEEYATSTYLRTDLMQYYPPDVEGVEYMVYTLPEMGELPETVVVTAPDGADAEVEFEEETNTYLSGVVYSEELETEYGEFAVSALQKYSAYVQASETVGLGSLQAYFDVDSDAYADVVEAGRSRWMVMEWSGIDFEDVEVGEFYEYTPEIFSCRVSFAQVLHRSGQEDFIDYIDMYLFLHRTNAGYKIYEWYNA